MGTAHDELESFHQFAVERLGEGQAVASLDELFMQWYDSQAQDEINAAIRQGLADVAADRYQPADQAMESIRR